MEILRLTGMEIDTVEREFPVLRADFGGGLIDTAFPTANGGLHRWTISSNCLPGDDAYGELIEGVSRFDYYLDFFKRHTIGADDVFAIEFRGKYYHVGLAEPQLSFEMLTYDLFAGGVEIEQRRVPGYAYNPDGSADLTPPTVPEGLTLDVLGSTSLRASWYPAVDVTDETDDAAPFTPNAPTLEVLGDSSLRVTWEAVFDPTDADDTIPPDWPAGLALEVLGTTSLRATWDEAVDPDTVAEPEPEPSPQTRLVVLGGSLVTKGGSLVTKTD